MMESFLDLLEGLHRWCVEGQGPDLPAQLVQSRSRLAAKLQTSPVSEAEWLERWRMPLGRWWPPPLPVGWAASDHLLSHRESTLTVEALLVLEQHRPGTTMAALPEPPASQPSPSVTTELDGDAVGVGVEGPIATTAQWNLQDLVTCVIREVARRERAYPQLIHQHRLTAEQARQELSQMRAVQAYLLSKLQEGVTPEQQVLF